MAARTAPASAARGDQQEPAAGLAPRLALLVVAVVFSGFVVNAMEYVTARSTGGTHVAPAVFCLAATLVLQVGFFSNPAVDVRTPTGHGALLVQAALVAGPLALYDDAFSGMQGFLAGDALLVLRPLAGWPVFAAIALANGYLHLQFLGMPLVSCYVVSLTAVMGLVVYGLSRLRSLVEQLADARAELAVLAVARERLRFARDLHDLLGFSLSAITLKTELARRLVPSQPERASRELGEVVDVSRHALADVRAVASSYRELSLEHEVAAARSVLAAAGVAVEVRCGIGDLPAPARTVLATVVREGVTNVLRHADAERCEITAARSGDRVSIEIVNDGARETGHDAVAGRADPGCGIHNLTTRVEALGGTLTAGPGAGSTFRLRAELPVRRAEDDLVPARRSGPQARTPVMAPRLGSLITISVLSGYTLNSMIFIVQFRSAGRADLVIPGCMLASLAIVLGFFGRRSARVRSPLGYVLLGVLAVVTFLPVALFASPFFGPPGLLAGSLLLALPARIGLPLFLVVVAAAGTAYLATAHETITETWGFLVTVNQGLVVFALTRLSTMVQELHDTRSELAELAVTEERLHFARDLHDLLGNALSAITLRTEVARRMVDRDPERVQEELFAVLDTSRQSLADVRAVASSYRERSLDEDIATAQRR